MRNKPVKRFIAKKLFAKDKKDGMMSCKCGFIGRRNPVPGYIRNQHILLIKREDLKTGEN